MNWRKALLAIGVLAALASLARFTWFCFELFHVLQRMS